MWVCGWKEAGAQSGLSAPGECLPASGDFTALLSTKVPRPRRLCLWTGAEGPLVHLSAHSVSVFGRGSPERQDHQDG